MRTGWLPIAGALMLMATSAGAQVRVTMASGQVSISARNATVSQILTEWARVGQTRIVNVERLGGTPLTLELANVSELQALEILLRGAGGYVIAPRANAGPSLSQFDRILVVPTSNAPRTAVPSPVSSTSAQPTPRFRPNQGADADEPGTTATPAFQRQPAAEQDAARDAATPPPPAGTSRFGAPSSQFGVARPGMIAPTPTPNPNAPSNP